MCELSKLLFLSAAFQPQLLFHNMVSKLWRGIVLNYVSNMPAKPFMLSVLQRLDNEIDDYEIVFLSYMITRGKNLVLLTGSFPLPISHLKYVDVNYCYYLTTLFQVCWTYLKKGRTLLWRLHRLDLRL